mgnify:CR=1 FL=1
MSNQEVTVSQVCRRCAAYSSDASARASEWVLKFKTKQTQAEQITLYQLVCRCGQSTPWCGSLADARLEWTGQNYRTQRGETV